MKMESVIIWKDVWHGHYVDMSTYMQTNACNMYSGKWLTLMCSCEYVKWLAMDHSSSIPNGYGEQKWKLEHEQTFNACNVKVCIFSEQCLLAAWIDIRDESTHAATCSRRTSISIIVKHGQKAKWKLRRETYFSTFEIIELNKCMRTEVEKTRKWCTNLFAYSA